MDAEDEGTSSTRRAPHNRLYHGDNRDVLVHLLANGFQGQARLIYIDPPFDTGGEHKRKVRLRNQSGSVIGEQPQYRDAWSGDSYLQFIYERLLLLRKLLAEDGSIWLHCDYRWVHHLHLLLEEVFGTENYLNTITWRSQVARGAKVNAFYFPYSAQYLEVFAKNRQTPTLWHPQKKRIIFTRAQATAQFMEDERGFFRTSDPGDYSFERLRELHTEGRLYAPYAGKVMVDEQNRRVYTSNGGNIGVKYYLTRLDNDRYAVERGVDNLWDDIPGLGVTPGEDVGYPTQKTEALLRRIIAASTNPGDLVLDCFVGSGTTVAVAQKMGRRWIGSDLSYGAIQTTRRRLQRFAQASAPGFAIYRIGVPLDEHAGKKQEVVEAKMQIWRTDGNPNQIEVAVMDCWSSAIARLLQSSGKQIQIQDWRELVDAIDIAPAYTGRVFCGQLADSPQKKRVQVRGHYIVVAPLADKVTVAVRITDILGNETLITSVV